MFRDDWKSSCGNERGGTGRGGEDHGNEVAGYEKESYTGDVYRIVVHTWVGARSLLEA